MRELRDILSKVNNTMGNGVTMIEIGNMLVELKNYILSSLGCQFHTLQMKIKKEGYS